MASSLRIELNGTLINGRIDGIGQFNVTRSFDTTEGRISSSFSSELTFYDDGYDILYQNLVVPYNGIALNVSVRIYDDCCSEAVYEGIIRGDGIDWCEPGCYITASIIENDERLNCIKSTLLWDNHNNFTLRNHPIIRYCIETRPEFISYVLILITAVLQILISSVLLTVFGALLAIPVVGPIIAAVGAIAFLDDIRDLMKEVALLTIQCGRYHPSPYVRDYITNVCQKCNLGFKSSILNDVASPYYNTVLVSAPIKKGRDKNDTNDKVISDNLPVETLETFLNNYLRIIFNADYRIINNDLVFERKDYFSTTVNWIDAESILNNNDIEDNVICYSWVDKERYAYGRFQYQMDGQDYAGNEAIDRWSDIVDWNIPYDPTRSGYKDVQMPCSAARFRDDGIDQNVYDFMQTAFGGLVNNTLFAGAFSSYDKTLLIPNGTFFNYKFLIYDTSQGRNGNVKRDYDNAFCGGDPYAALGERYNYPYWFLEGFKNNLYSLFHYIDDPRLPSATPFNFKFTFKFDCNDLRTFSFDKTIRLIKSGQAVNGQIREVSIDFNNRTIAIQGVV